jgi:hypothetical protein
VKTLTIDNTAEKLTDLKEAPTDHLPATSSANGRPAEQRSGLGNLAAALAKAQAKCKAAAKDAEVRGKTIRYKYTSSEAIIIEAKEALADSGLAPVASAPKLCVVGSGSIAAYTMKRNLGLLHSSGESLPLGELEWPVLCDAYRPLDKAFAGAVTTSLAYALRDLLLMPRVDPADDQAGRNEEQNAQAPPAAQTPPSPVPTNPPSSSAPPAGLTDQQEAELTSLIRETGTDAAKLLKHFGVPVLKKLTAEAFTHIRGELLRRKSQTQPTAPPTPAVPLLSTEQLAALDRAIQTSGTPSAGWLTAIGVTTLDRVPASHATWLRLLAIQKGDPVDSLKQLQVQRFLDIPVERIVPMTRGLLVRRVDELVEKLKITPEQWNAGLKAYYGHTDPTKLTAQQLDEIEARLAAKAG